jgi:hypothetical protein
LLSGSFLGKKHRGRRIKKEKKFITEICINSREILTSMGGRILGVRNAEPRGLECLIGPRATQIFHLKKAFMFNLQPMLTGGGYYILSHILF